MFGRGVTNRFWAMFLGSSGANPSGWSTGPSTLRTFAQMSSINLRDVSIGLRLGDGGWCPLLCVFAVLCPVSVQSI